MFSAFKKFGKLGALASSVARAWSPLALWPDGIDSPGMWISPRDLASQWQDSAGTTPVVTPGTVADSSNPVGLALDIRAGTPVLGPELVVNGDFSSGMAGWTLAGYTTAGTPSGGSVRLSGIAPNTNFNPIAYQIVAVAAGKTYVVTFPYSIAAGNVDIGLYASGESGANIGAIPGTQTIHVVAISTTLSLTIYAWNGASTDVPFDVTVGPATVKEVPGLHMLQSTSVDRPLLSARVNLLTGTATLSTQSVTVAAGAHTMFWTGAGTVTASGAYSGALTSGQTFTTTAGTLTLTVAGSVTSAQLNTGSTALRYQSVTDASNYDYSGFPLYWKFDKVDDRLLVTVPPGGWTGTMIHSTIAGTISYAATLPAGSFAIGTNGMDNYYTPDNRLVGQIFVNSALSDSDAGKVKDYFVSRGGGPKDAGAYAGVTDFSLAWSGCSSMSGPFPLIDTSNGTNFSAAWAWCSSMSGPFPLIDTSSGTNFSYAWLYCASMTGPFPLIDTSSGTNFSFAWDGCTSMTGPFPLIDTSNGTNFSAAWAECSSMTGPFPLIDTSSGTNFSYAWYGCSSLTSFPAGMFDTCPATNFTDAFVYCALNQTSIDNILVSIAAAGTSGGTLNMTGGTNATPSATGLAAKATLVGRGWTVTHN